MVTDTLIQYVERQLRKAVDPQQVRQVLKAKGWTPQDIDIALSKAGGA
ncbi:MAG: winged helix-turn-helix domain-containing protein, partial [Meiothermus silvanus]|nr:winged helix-turn-helix domain-containing protein [Allomeiothermus silvanus]